MDKLELAIQQIMAQVFEMPFENITTESHQDNVENWDSLKHLELIVVLEEEFKIEFPLEEIGHLVSFKIIEAVLKEQLQNAQKTY